MPVIVKNNHRLPNAIEKIKKTAYMLNNYHVTDALEGLSQLPDACIDAVVTSPPYNLAGLAKSLGKSVPLARNAKCIWNPTIDYDSKCDAMPEAEYKEFIVQVLNELARVVKPAGSIFLNHKFRRVRIPIWNEMRCKKHKT